MYLEIGQNVESSGAVDNIEMVQFTFKFNFFLNEVQLFGFIKHS
jgi:hypothetical protein